MEGGREGRGGEEEKKRGRKRSYGQPRGNIAHLIRPHEVREGMREEGE